MNSSSRVPDNLEVAHHREREKIRKLKGNMFATKNKS